MQLELKSLQREVGITFVYVTHDQEEALTMSDTIIVMRDGRIQQAGGPVELYERPANRFVADFIGTSNFLKGAVEGVADDGRLTVRTDLGLVLHGRLTDPDTTPGVGDAVIVAVRPERLHAGHRRRPSPLPTDVRTRVAGRINQGTYLGDQTEFRVHTDVAGELLVRRQNEASLGGAHLVSLRAIPSR